MPPQHKRPQSRTEFALSPVYWAFATILLAFVGLLGSVFSSEIKSAFPFAWERPPWDWVWPAALFWVLLLLSAFVFGWQRRIESEAQAQSRAALDAQVDALHKEQQNAAQQADKLLCEQKRLQEAQVQAFDLSAALREEQETGFEMVHSMPPEGFLEQFTFQYAIAESATTQVLLDQAAWNDPERIKQSLHVVLLCYARLAHAFDASPPESYLANIMLFHASEGLRMEQRQLLRDRLAFCDETTAVSNLRGVLDLRRDLAVRLDPRVTSETHDPPSHLDRELKPFALPVPKRVSTHRGKTIQKSKLLPGAPTAFAEQRAEFYADMDQMLEWCRQHGDFTEEVMGDVQEYFRVDAPPFIGSFASAPLPLADVNPETSPIGVVNLHRRTRGLLKERKRSADTFTHASSPFLHLLHRLLLVLQSAEQADSGCWCNLLPPESTSS
ncbi:MAG: hypothetical protein LCH53_01525 [Bacteroidetes bacterium]|nr:hypothetical protein [Bacteroidota bacterium]